MKQLTPGEVREIQLDILREVDTYCRRHKIIYFLAYGTLIGSIRHRGFIPWDDDIDIAMPRNDFLRFCNDFNKHHSGRLRVLSSDADRAYPYTYAKVEDTTTVVVENIRQKFPLGVNIDVFPLDGLPSGHLFRLFHIGLARVLQMMLVVKKLRLHSPRKFMKQVLIILMKTILAPISYVTIIKAIVNHARKIPYETADYVCNLVDTVGIKEVVRRELFDSVLAVEFEGEEYYVPKGYNEWLRTIYGDYMKLPPPESRVSHHQFVAYRK